MDYRQFSAVDLATDPSFIDWVQRPDPTSTAFWEDHLAQEPSHAEVVATARQLVTGWHINQPVPSAGSMNEVWQNIQTDIARTTQKRPTIWLNRFVGEHSPYMRYAAVFLGVMLVTVISFWISGQWTTTRYATGKGETKTVLLPDGSSIVLAANSAITLAGDWQPEHNRELALQGEAFFSVTHQKNHQKFIVRTANNLRVEVLGTRFTVTNRPANTQVVLNSGKVALYLDKETQPLLMKPGELIEVPKISQQQVVRRNVQPEVYSAWKDNRFVFDDTSLGEIAAMIETDFGCTVQFSNESLKNLRTTVRLPNRDLNLLLTSLAEIHDLKIDRQASHIEITPLTVSE